jgi:hypothetical protein
MSSKSETEKDVQSTTPASTLVDFLENMSPGQLVGISDLAEMKADYNGRKRPVFRTPEIMLNCPNEACNGNRFFRPIKEYDEVLSEKAYEHFYVSYICSNCQKYVKTFSLAAKLVASTVHGECFKYGEFPPFGPPTPSRLISMIGPDRDLFLKGRTCENQGLGIGAFTYYRRVVENQKNRILSEILKVAEKVHEKEDVVVALKAAIEETQFSKSLKSVKDHIPQSLLIDGHNPLLLLHDALSSVIHEKTDEESMEIASSVRIVLGELAERISQALKDEAELKKALNTLFRK